MTTRAYLPATLPLLADWHAAGEIPAVAERIHADGADEESEYDALMAAAVASAGLQPAGGRRVVVVAETASPGGPIRFRDVVAVHCDTVDRAADADADDDLAWFATQEIPDLI